MADAGAAAALATGTRVRVEGLQAAAELNGAIGVVIGEPQPDTGRVPVRVLGRPGGPGGILARPANLAALPPQRAVKVRGSEAVEALLTRQQARQLAEGEDPPWRACRVPALLGLPLALRQLAPTRRLQSEHVAVYMMVDPVTGFAPDWVQMNGLGEVLLARSDGARPRAGGGGVGRGLDRHAAVCAAADPHVPPRAA
jgi:hypothetical protein